MEKQRVSACTPECPAGRRPSRPPPLGRQGLVRGATGAGIVLTLLALTGFQSASDTRSPDVVRVEVTGVLRTGIMAIGAETTGTMIQSGDIGWELDLGGDAALRARAKEMNGKRVTVTGTYRRKAGVEIPWREIVTVETLQPAQGTP